MKFGISWIEKRQKYKAPNGNNWIDWFAWYPVTIKEPMTDYGKQAWFEIVQWRYSGGMTYNNPEYRFKPE